MDMKIIEKGFDKYAEIKITSQVYCQSCGIGFNTIELVFFAPLDNNIICKHCAVEHTELQPRLFVYKGRASV